MVAVPDDQLIRQTAAGDRDAFAAIYQRHHATIYRFARLMTGSNALAEDVVQDVFLVLMRNAARYEAGRSSLTTYLYGIARHQTRRRLMRERRFVAFDGQTVNLATDAATGDVAADLEYRSEVRRLRRAIVALPSRYREVVVLCDLQDVSYADAAAAIGCAVGTIRSRLHRARQLLTRTLRPSGEPAVQTTSMRCTV